MYMNRFLVVTLVILFASCTPPLVVMQKQKTTTDSTSTKITYQKQVDTFTVAADSLKMSVPLASLTTAPIYAVSPSGRSTGSVRRVDDTIEVQCFTDKYEQIIETQNQLIETLIKLTETTETTETVTEFKTPWYAKALSAIGIIAMLVLVGSFVVNRYLKPI